MVTAESKRIHGLRQLCEGAEFLREKAATHPTTRSADDYLSRFKREVTPGVVLTIINRLSLEAELLNRHQRALAKIAGIELDDVHILVNKILDDEIDV